MARRSAPPLETAGPRPAELLAQAATPWTEGARGALLTARDQGRLPHAVLLHGGEGAGQSGVALWAAQLALCDDPSPVPCGACAACTLFLAGNHPDLHSVGLDDKAKFIKVEQVRNLCAELGLTSYRGGRKVGIIDPANRMNINSFNALLKTLEEPSENTLLLLVASALDRLPKTVVSRCQRIPIPNPPLTESAAWLEAAEPGHDWPLLLDLAGGAPLRALALAREGTGALAAEMAAAIEEGRLDPLRLADEWSRDRPAERLAWLEHWLGKTIRATLGGPSDAVNNNRDMRLPSRQWGVNITTAFRLLDRVRDARRLLESSLNAQLLFEDLLVGLAEALAGREPG